MHLATFLKYLTVTAAQRSIQAFVPQLPLYHATSPTMSTTANNEDILSHLQVSIKQTSKSPPVVGIKVTNNGPDTMTILTWESPLDELVLPLGLLTLTPRGGTKPLEIPTIKVSRELPPGDESLVSLAPGESQENQVTLREPLVPLEYLKGEGASVGLKGRWVKVWPMARGELTREMIERSGMEGEGASGQFQVEAIDIEVE